MTPALPTVAVAAATSIRRSVRPVALGLAALALLGACSSGGSTSAPLPTVNATAVNASASPVPAASAATSPEPSGATPVGSPDGSAAAGACPTSQPAPLPAGEKRTVKIDTPKGPITMEIDGALSPIAAGNFVALAECGYYDGVVFHRLVPGFVIQGGDGEFGRVGADGKLPGEAARLVGTGDLGYTIKDEPVTAQYGRGVVAMARKSTPDSADSQFFIVLDDGARDALASYNTYQILGKVTAGMEVVDAIAAMPNAGEAGGNAALDPIPMTKVTVGK